jgi:hypothetical protein
LELVTVELLIASLIKEFSAFYEARRHYPLHQIPPPVPCFEPHECGTNTQLHFVKYTSLCVFFVAGSIASQTVGVGDKMIVELLRTWKEAVAA